MLEDLTRREREVFMKMASGMSNKEAAKELGISVYTLKVHKQRIAQKTGLETTVGWAKLAIRLNLIKPIEWAHTYPYLRRSPDEPPDDGINFFRGLLIAVILSGIFWAWLIAEYLS